MIFSYVDRVSGAGQGLEEGGWTVPAHLNAQRVGMVAEEAHFRALEGQVPLRKGFDIRAAREPLVVEGQGGGGRAALQRHYSAAAVLEAQGCREVSLDPTHSPLGQGSVGLEVVEQGHLATWWAIEQWNNPTLPGQGAWAPAASAQHTRRGQQSRDTHTHTPSWGNPRETESNGSRGSRHCPWATAARQ